MQQLKTTRFFTRLTFFVMISLTIWACGDTATKTDEVQADSLSSAPADSLPAIDDSANVRPDGAPTRVRQ